MLTPTTILLRRQLVVWPEASGETKKTTTAHRRAQATCLSNLAYYGYAPDREGLARLEQCDTEILKSWWAELEPSLKSESGEDRNIGDSIVYQNFPEEVLAMDEADYWFRQILMYLGVPKEQMREAPKDRPALFEDVDVKILRPASESSLEGILTSHLRKSKVWIPTEREEIEWFAANGYAFDLSEVPFKENMILAGLACMQAGQEVRIDTTTDVLRFYAGLSKGDISLKTNTKFVSLPRSQRRQIVRMLSEVGDLEEGLVRHRNKWKRALHALHIGEYGKTYPEVVETADRLRNGKPMETFNGQVEMLIVFSNPKVLDLLKTRPGDFARRLAHMVRMFGAEAVEAFGEVVDQLPLANLLRLHKVLEKYNEIDAWAVAPKGSWTKMQILEKDADHKLPESERQALVGMLEREIGMRMNEKFPQGVQLGERTKWVKLPTNNADGALPYGSGTVFPLADNIKFIRSATYWVVPGRTCWMDNGWNFFKEDWSAIGTIAWNLTGEMKPAAVFSGDPVNSQNTAGRAGQLIDLYLDQLVDKGIRYAVWNILSYSRIPFDQAEEVMGLLQVGEEPMSGKLIEPSRSQFVFKVTGHALTNYVCVLDLVKRQIIYLDAPLPGKVSSAMYNARYLEEKMPVFMDYLGTIPSVHDVMRHVKPSSNGMPVLYDDKDQAVVAEQAYVFSPRNEESSYEALSFTDLIN
ncbi:MAG: hypothetical protein AAF741_14725 [Bacteroidota bacterium]